MDNENPNEQQSTESTARWQPLCATDRRVVGVLAEKAKTTPDNYPLSLSAVCTACNQKSNRAPVMNLQPEEVEESLERLRDLGAAGIVEGHGRVAKYRHYLYEWLGVDKVELAVMAELLLRGAQTVGELRGRAARMEPIPDLAALRPILTALKARELLLPLSPEGRGHVVTHALYEPHELEQVRAQYGPAPAASAVREPTPARQPAGAVPMPSGPAVPPVEKALIATIRQELDELHTRLTEVRVEVEQLSSRQDQVDDELRSLKDALGG
jgi:uncharacterized protein YceH (UPF0502 family)